MAWDTFHEQYSVIFSDILMKVCLKSQKQAVYLALEADLRHDVDAAGLRTIKV